MNKSQRAARLRKIADVLQSFVDQLDELRDDAQEQYDTLTEGAQDGPRGDSITDEIEIIEQASADTGSAAEALVELCS